MRFLLLCFFLICISAQAQYIQRDSASIDSLKNAYLSEPHMDTSKVSSLLSYLMSKEQRFSGNDSTFLEAGIDLAISLDFKQGIINLYDLKAKYNQQKSRFEQATYWAIQSDSMARTIGDKRGILIAQSTLINVAFIQRDFKSALHAAEEIVQLIENDPLNVDNARHYFTLGKCLGALSRHDEALSAYQTALSISEETGFAPGITISYASIADTYIHLKDYEKALPLLIKVHEVFKSEGRSTNFAASHFTLARCYLGLQQVNKAIYHAQLARDINRDLNNMSYLKDNYLTLAKGYMLQGDMDKSETYIDSAFMVLDSINDEQRIETIENLKTKYQTDRIEQEKELVETQNRLIAKEKEEARIEAEKNRLISIIAIISLFLISGLLWFAMNRWLLSRRQKEELDVAYEKLEESKKLELAASNLKAIKSQMNPHFIFNSINSIQDTILQQDTLQSYDHLVIFSQLVRTVLDHSEREFIPIAEEIQFLKTYLDLEKLRFKDDFSFNLENQVTSGGVLIPSLIIQPFIENAIKHGLMHKSGLKHLQITLTDLNDTTIKCALEDNGIGLTKSKEINQKRTNHRSFSTQAIQQRLDLLSDQTQSKAAFTMRAITNETGDEIGTRVDLILPIKAVVKV